MTDNKQYPPFPGKPTTSLFSTSIRFVSEEELRDYVDADRAMGAAQAAPASQDAEDALVAALIECDRLTESMRIWAGMGYHYHPPQARQIHDTARAAINAARAKQEGK